jgi:hypothetical protein
MSGGGGGGGGTGVPYEPTLIPAHVFKDGLNVVLSPTEINHILLQICVEDISEDANDDGCDGAEGDTVTDDDGGDGGTLTKLDIELLDSMGVEDAIDRIGSELEENQDTERITITGSGCSKHHYSVIAACMAWYAVHRCCPRVYIRDTFPDHADGPRRIGHSKGYALRKHALTARPSGFSAIMLKGIAHGQKSCAKTAPPLKRKREDTPGLL